MTPVGVFFICQNEDKCHFVNSTIIPRILSANRILENHVKLDESRRFTCSRLDREVRFFLRIIFGTYCQAVICAFVPSRMMAANLPEASH